MIFWHRRGKSRSIGGLRNKGGAAQELWRDNLREFHVKGVFHYDFGLMAFIDDHSVKTLFLMLGLCQCFFGKGEGEAGVFTVFKKFMTNTVKAIGFDRFVYIMLKDIFHRF